MARQHLINSSDVFFIKGFIVQVYPRLLLSSTIGLLDFTEVSVIVRKNNHAIKETVLKATYNYLIRKLNSCTISLSAGLENDIL